MSYDIVKHKDKVYEIKNFLNSEEQESLLQIAKSISESDWSLANDGNPHWENRTFHTDERIVNLMYEKIYQLFTSLGYVNTIGVIQRYLPGMSMGVHEDVHGGGNNLIFGLVLYLNDDFIGGEINYPNLNLSIKPTAGSLFMHPGTEPHFVSTVLDGPTRYIMSSFVFSNEENDVILNSELFN